MYAFLASVFAFSILLALLIGWGVLFKPSIWRNHSRKILAFAFIWFVPYLTFILFFTGPENLKAYPPRETSPYKLPWQAGVSRILSQGNRSFTSHQGLHHYAWDFVMPNGTEILAARAGRVYEIEQGYSTIGLRGNYVLLQHDDGEISGYFHIQKDSVFVKLGEQVKQGQPIALSGMTGQTTLPHLHFVVFNSDQSASIPVSFQEVESGVPLAGHVYKSSNVLQPDDE